MAKVKKLKPRHMEAPPSGRIWVPRPGAYRHGPCTERDCGHAACEEWREIAASPCMLCRHVIGTGCYILDERLPHQKAAGMFYVGFTHVACRAAARRQAQVREHNRALVDRPKRARKLAPATDALQIGRAGADERARRRRSRTS